MDIEWALTGGRPFTHKLRRKLLRVWVAPVGSEVDRSGPRLVEVRTIHNVFS